MKIDELAARVKEMDARLAEAETKLAKLDQELDKEMDLQLSTVIALNRRIRLLEDLVDNPLANDTFGF